MKMQTGPKYRFEYAETWDEDEDEHIVYRCNAGTLPELLGEFRLFLQAVGFNVEGLSAHMAGGKEVESD